jgi:hypothetical protein
MQITKEFLISYNDNTMEFSIKDNNINQKLLQINAPH